MVELRLDPVESVNLPNDCYVSVRVGETQKLSKLSATRLYRFPQAGDRRYGKIEVFKRIGQCSVDVDPQNQGVREVSISCQEAGFGSLGLKVAVKQEGEEQPQQEAAAEANRKGNNKVKAAKEYLAKHSLEMRLSDAMQAVLRERPEDPAQFMAQKLLATGNNGRVRLPPVERSGLPEQSPTPPMPARAPGTMSPVPPASRPGKKAPSRPHKLEPLHRDTQGGAAGEGNFTPYYAEHFKSAAMPAFSAMHAKFAKGWPKRSPPKPPALLPFKPFYAQHLQPCSRDALAWLYPKFKKVWSAAAQQSSKPAAPQLATEFPAYYRVHFKAAKTAAVAQLQDKFSKAWSPAAQQSLVPKIETGRRSGAAVKCMPSVATWLKPLPRHVRAADATTEKAVVPAGGSAPPGAQAPAFAYKPSVGSWLARPQRGLAALPAPVCAKTEAQEAAPSPAGKAFTHKPSVMTWLQPLPKPRAEARPSAPANRAAAYARKASVGTWLAHPSPIGPPQDPFAKKASVGTWLVHVA